MKKSKIMEKSKKILASAGLATLLSFSVAGVAGCAPTSTINPNVDNDTSLQLQEINDQLQQNEIEINELQEELEKAQEELEKTQEELKETQANSNSQQEDDSKIEELKAQIAKLELQNALNVTFNTRYNYIYGNDTSENKSFSILGYFSPNGNYSSETVLEKGTEYIYSENGLEFHKNAQNEEYVNVSDLNMYTSYTKQIAKAEVVANGSTYSFASGDSTYDVNLSQGGYIESMVQTVGKNRAEYHFKAVEKSSYEANTSVIAQKIASVGYYQNAKQSITDSLTSKYSVLSGAMTSDQYSGTIKMALANNKQAGVQTITDLSSDSTLYTYNVGEDGTWTYAGESEDGDLDIYNKESSTNNSLADDLIKSLTSRDFTISYDKSTNTYTLSQKGRQTLSFAINEDGTFTDFTLTNSGDVNQVAKYHIEKVNDKKTFEKEFNAIKEDMLNLIDNYENKNTL